MMIDSQCLRSRYSSTALRMTDDRIESPIPCSASSHMTWVPALGNTRMIQDRREQRDPRKMICDSLLDRSMVQSWEQGMTGLFM